MSVLNEQLALQDIGQAEQAIKTLTQKGHSPRILSKYPQFNQRVEDRQKEDVHRQLVRGEMRINRENSQKRLIAALIQPQTQLKAELDKPATNRNKNLSQTEYKVRSIQTPVVDKLDPSVSFIAQLRRATKQMDEQDAQAFRNVQDSLAKAKKDKLDQVRDAQKQLAVKSQQEEAAEATAKLHLEQIASGKIRKQSLKASQRMAQNSQKLDFSTYKGKMKILRDVNEAKYPLPKNFPTLAELTKKNVENQSSHYQKTAQRRQQIDMKRQRIQDGFVEDAPTMLPAFRKTTRDYHVEKEHAKLLHGAPIGRYSPSYDRVWTKAPAIQIAGVKDRFGYDNKNSPNYVKRPEGQISAMGDPAAFQRERKSMVTMANPQMHRGGATSRNRANKTVVAFKNPTMSMTDSIEQLSGAGKTIGTNFKNSGAVKVTDTQGSQGGESELNQQSASKMARKQYKTQTTMTTGTQNSVSESRSQQKLMQRNNSGALSLSPSKTFLPNTEDLKYNSSYLIAQNQNRTVKAFDFMGYAKRKEIYDGFSKPVDSRFETPTNVCPLVSTKHKYSPKVSIGKYSPRVFFTDKIRDWPFK